MWIIAHKLSQACPDFSIVLSLCLAGFEVALQPLIYTTLSLSMATRCPYLALLPTSYACSKPAKKTHFQM
jgi:hypothetical protein